MFLVLACTAVCAAQGTTKQSDVPNLSGRWVAESIKLYSDSRSLRKADQDLKIEMLIVQSENELKVNEMTIGDRGTYSRDAVYYLDGRGESNKGFTGGFKYESKTVFRDQKLYIEATIQFPNSRGNSTQTEEWELSTDGKTLTIKTNNTGSRQNSPIRYEKVFRLAS